MSADRVDIADAIIVGIAGGGTVLEQMARVVHMIGEAGYAIVPKEPTREMWAAGGDAVVNHPSMHHDRIIGDVWPAMIAAAQSA